MAKTESLEMDAKVIAALPNTMFRLEVDMGGKTHHLLAAGAHLEKALAAHPEHPVCKAMASHVSGHAVKKEPKPPK